MATERFDAIVIGAGILGLAVARRLLVNRPRLSVLVVEKEQEVASHQSGHNSGVIHSGIYYAPGSLKARLCVAGKNELEAYAAERAIPLERRGKLIVAASSEELPRLEELRRRGETNGVPGLVVLDRAGLQRIEPHAVGLRALWAPQTAVIDYRAVARSFAAEIRAAGARIELGERVTSIDNRSQGATIRTERREAGARLVIACAGLQADRVAAFTTRRPSGPRIVPFRGDYYTVTERAARLVNGLIYPVPDPAFPFLGVHFTRRIDDSVIAGPNAVLAFARETYRRLAWSWRDVTSTFTHAGAWRFAKSNARIGGMELWRDISKRAFVADMQRYVPEITGDDVSFGPVGIRAQTLGANGKLIDDFLIETHGRTIHVINAPSPAATSSLAIARHVESLAGELLDR
jgi:L-2-hydroxyglutarate oxidase